MVPTDIEECSFCSSDMRCDLCAVDSASPLSSPNSRRSYQKKYRDNLTAAQVDAKRSANKVANMSGGRLDKKRYFTTKLD